MSRTYLENEVVEFPGWYCIGKRLKNAFRQAKDQKIPIRIDQDMIAPSQGDGKQWQGHSGRTAMRNYMDEGLFESLKIGLSNEHKKPRMQGELMELW